MQIADELPGPAILETKSADKARFTRVKIKVCAETKNNKSRDSTQAADGATFCEIRRTWAFDSNRSASQRLGKISEICNQESCYTLDCSLVTRLQSVFDF